MKVAGKLLPESPQKLIVGSMHGQELTSGKTLCCNCMQVVGSLGLIQQ